MSTWKVHRRKGSELLDHLCQLRSINRAQIIPDYNRDLHDPNLLSDLDITLAILKKAQRNREFITIFGDYDADGTPASALMSICLKKIGINHQVILPTRQEGYGLSDKIIEAIPRKTDILITIDNGITACQEIRKLKQNGMKIIILDHHLPLDEIPPADAIIDPHLPNSAYPFKDLCGCAITFKVAQAMSENFKEIDSNYIKWLLDLVAISTVADMVPLIGENRALVHFGLLVLKKGRRPGLREMTRLASLHPSKINSRSLGFIYGPRLNASGRLEDNNNAVALELLLSENEDEASNLASLVEQNNRERLRMIDGITQEANDLIFKQNERNDRLYIVTGENWSFGLIGLVAGRLCQLYNRPVIVGSILGDQVRASARSIESFHILEALAVHQKYLIKYGGHRQAAGFSSEIKKWDSFAGEIKKKARNELDDDSLERVWLSDGELKEEEISLKSAKEIESLQPFGIGNEEPLFIVKDVSFLEVKKVGSGKDHLKLKCKKNDKIFDAIAFNGANVNRANVNKANYLTASSPDNYDILARLKINNYQGRDNVEMELSDWQKSPSTVKTIISNG